MIVTNKSNKIKIRKYHTAGAVPNCRTRQKRYPLHTHIYNCSLSWLCIITSIKRAGAKLVDGPTPPPI